MGQSSQDERCRRRALRFPLPLEVELHHRGQIVRAIIRDASIDDNLQDGMFGVGLLHDDKLPLHEPLHCRTVTDCQLLSADARLTLTWSRSFGTDGFLSGGRILCDAETVDVSTDDEPRTCHSSSAVRPSDG